MACEMCGIYVVTGQMSGEIPQKERDFPLNPLTWIPNNFLEPRGPP
jgi:hypothetical protein